MSDNYNFAMVPARCFTDRNLKYMHMALLGLIASYRNRDTGWCYPSLSTLSEDLGLSPNSGPSQVSKAIKVLKDLRYIDVIHGGGEQSSQYRIIYDAPPPQINKGVLEKNYNAPLEENNKWVLEKNYNQTRAINKRYKQEIESDSLAQDFEEFWHRYPRKDGKKPAWAKYTAARKKFTHSVIMAGLEAHLPSMAAKEPQFIPHAATWLHQERFNDPAPAMAQQRNNGFSGLVQDRIAQIGVLQGPKPNRFLIGGRK